MAMCSTRTRWNELIVLSSIGLFVLNQFSICSAVDHEYWKEDTETERDDYVNPSDMGSYQHVGQRNFRGVRHGHRHSSSVFEEKHVRRTIYTMNDGRDVPGNLDITPESTLANSDVDSSHSDSGQGLRGQQIIVEEITRKTHDYNQSKVNPGQGSPGMIFLKRVIASILAQMNVRNHFFGPKEAITIDLQAEISHEDLTTLNKFIASEAEEDSQSFLVMVDNIVSKLFHVVSPVPVIGFYEYFKETIGFGMFYSMKFWLTLFSTFVVFLLTVILLIQTYQARSPAKVILFGVAIFFILSCVWVFVEFYEKSKAVNAARLHQYQAVPKDCNFDNLGYLDTWGYYIRVHMMGYDDRCEQYHKEILLDPFYKTSPVEAISDTFSKLIFHPLEYVGDKVGKFFAGVISAVPFWLQPIMLVMMFVFLFLAIFRYSIHTPFLSIEPSRRNYPQLEGSPLRAQQNNQENQQQIIERPLASIVRAALKDASTSTDDLEDFIRNSEENMNEPLISPYAQWYAYLDMIQATVTSALYILIGAMSFLLREVPNEPEDIEIVPEQPDAAADAEPVPVIELNAEALAQHGNEGVEVVLNQPERPEVLIPNPIPNPDVRHFDEEIFRDVQIRSPRKERAGAYGWVYVGDDEKENTTGSGSSNSSNDSVNLITMGGGDGVGSSRQNVRLEHDVLFPNVKIGNVRKSGSLGYSECVKLEEKNLKDDPSS